MFASRTICSRCSSQLRSAAVPRLAIAARFATLADAPDSHPHQPHHSHRPARTRSAAFKDTSQDPAVALFNDVVSPAAAADDQDLAPPVLSELELVAKLDKLTQRDLSLKDEYDAFRSEIWPSVREMRGQVSKPIYLAVTLLLGKFRSHVASVGTIPGISVEISKMYGVLGKWDPVIRNDLVLGLCLVLRERKNPSSVRGVLMDELVTLWKHISQLKRTGEALQEPRFVLPSAQDLLKDLNRRSKKLPADEVRALTTQRAFSSIFLLFPPSQAEAMLPGLLATVAVLSDMRYSSSILQTEAAPLLNLVRLVVSKLGGLTEDDVTEIFKKKSEFSMPKQNKLRGYVLSQLPYMTKMLLYQSDKWQNGLDTSVDPEMARQVGLSNFHKQLQVAYRSRNTGAVISIWQNLNSSLQDHPKLRQAIRDDPHFLDYWIFVWCGIRRAGRVQETIELMKELGIEPTVKTYTSMLHGWKMCKDLAKIEALWGQLVQSGAKLDLVIWTERISALIEGGRPELGVKALGEMVETWKKAVREDRQEDAVEPTIAAVNAAFTGLIRHGDHQQAHEVLAWAGSEGFLPDIRTYNILIRESLRADHHEETRDLLRVMKEQKVQPDSATFTILLEGAISQIGEHSTVEEQLQAVSQVFEDMEDANLKPNQETYAKMLYAVTGLPNVSDEAVAAVQNHMRGRGLTVTPQMVTILVERELTHNPPDIGAIQQLLRDHNLKSTDQGDQTLWERVMSAHAIAGDPVEAMAIFDSLADAGRPVTSLPCLTDMMRAVVEKRDQQAAQRIVDVTLAYTRERGEENDRYWRHHFWYLARENGLLHGAKLPHQLMS
ncbi:hypothetical protein AK830_g6912 [Neonectria ditissima]|uniref:Pentatricopeptide repeat-containing protein n=1 Tax=Neonectria ditissima TaxID=78410 RepID=A0A0N8H6Q5_9HYPO|nr:hypothetical protein AK830_g6912 [Neonectria ditissima]